MSMSAYGKAMLSCIFTLLTFAALSQPDWQLSKDQDGISVYTKDENGSKFKAFKGIVILGDSVDEVLSILKNADEYSEWYGYTKTSILLKKEHLVQYNYVETIFPWPFRNRDMVYKMSIINLDSGAIKINLNGLSDYIPRKSGVVRMLRAEGYILLRPLNDKTEVTYVFHSEPGANIPVWLANSSIAELPFKTLAGLRAILNYEN